MENTDLCTYLLYLGRQDLKAAATLSKWIPKIRMFPSKLTSEDDLSWVPEDVQIIVKQAFEELSKNTIQKYDPEVKDQMDPEFVRLVRTLPIPLRLRIFGYATQCYMCRKRMCTIDTKVTDVKWLMFKGKPLCSKACLKRYSVSGGVGIDTLVDNLVAGAGIIPFENVRLCILR